MAHKWLERSVVSWVRFARLGEYRQTRKDSANGDRQRQRHW